ncbi:MAG: DUF4835 family protein [Flavobacterium sp.]|nr:MAG: DUF4835 family protein [Flavobacterium sp.]
MYKYTALLLLVVISFTANAQELNCTVKVNFDRITDANPQIFKTLEKSLSDFVNNTRWTTRNFARNEKIDCAMFINISAYDSNTFSATLQVQSSRAIFNSTYSSPMLNYLDKDMNFRYTEFENLFYDPNSFNSNLVAVVSFYANIIIGMDSDSFEKDSGTPYYEVAQRMVSLAQQSGYKGWSQQDGNQNRFFLGNDILSNNFRGFRESLYDYHLLGLDRMADNQKEAKEKVIAAIKTVAKVHSSRPNAFLTRVFFDAKSDELVQIFSGGPMVTTTELTETLNRISPMNSTKWSNIR